MSDVNGWEVYTAEFAGTHTDLKDKRVCLLDLYHTDPFVVVLEQNDTEEQVHAWVEQQREAMQLLYPDAVNGLSGFSRIGVLDKKFLDTWLVS